MKWISRSNYREFERSVELEGGGGERRWKFSKYERIFKFDRGLPDPLPLKRERKKKYTWNSENWKFSSENFHFFEENGKNTKATIESVVVVSIRGIGTKQFCQGASRRNATEPDRGKWSRGGGGGGGGGGHYCVRVPCTTTLRAVHACNRFSFHASPPLSPPPLSFGRWKLIKVQLIKITHFSSTSLGKGLVGWGSNQRSWLYHSGPLPPLRFEPNPFRFQPSSSPFFWKEKEKEKEERGMRKKFSSIDRWTRTVFEEEREFSGLIGVFSFFFFSSGGDTER